MTSVGSYEAKTYLPQFFERVEKGQFINASDHNVRWFVGGLAPLEKLPGIGPQDKIAGNQNLQSCRSVE